MQNSAISKYWKHLRTAWNDTFVLDVVRNLHNVEYILALGNTAGYDKDQVLKALRLIQGPPEELGWGMVDFIWQDAFADLTEISSALKFDIEVMPLIGTLPTGRVNAMAIRPPGKGGYILAFEVGLFDLICHMCDSLAVHFEPEDGDGAAYTYNAKEEVDEKSVMDITTALLRYYAQGMPFLGQRTSVLNLRQKGLSIALRKMIQLFIVGHEYGHIALKHLDFGRQLSFGLVDNSIHSEVIPDNQQQEFEADQAGFLISSTFHFKKGFPFWFSTAMMVYFLNLTGLIYFGLGLFLDKEVSNATHPSADERVTAIESHLLKIIGEKEFKYYTALRKFCDKIVEKVKESLTEDLLVLKRSNLFVLAPTWDRFREE